MPIDNMTHSPQATAMWRENARKLIHLIFSIDPITTELLYEIDSVKARLKYDGTETPQPLAALNLPLL